jgi:hypothetical protein
MQTSTAKQNKSMQQKSAPQQPNKLAYKSLQHTPAHKSAQKHIQILDIISSKSTPPPYKTSQNNTSKAKTRVHFTHVPPPT